LELNCILKNEKKGINKTTNMGLSTTTYVIHGFALNEEQSKYVQKNWFNNKLPMLKYIEGWEEVDGYALIYDGMTGKDHYFGKVLARNDMEDNFKEINFFATSDEELKQRFNNCFNNEVEMTQESKLLLVNHVA
jgi:hypothetical protein